MNKFIIVLLSIIIATLTTETSFGQLKKVRTMMPDGTIASLDFPADFRSNYGIQLGEELPKFVLIAITGDTISSKDFNDKLLVLNFWFVGCDGCKQEEPNLHRLTKELENEDIEFVSICRSTLSRTNSYIKKIGGFGYSVISIKSNKELENIFGSVEPFPTHMIVKNGVVKETFNFALTTDDEINWFKDRILEEMKIGM